MQCLGDQKFWCVNQWIVNQTNGLACAYRCRETTRPDGSRKRKAKEMWILKLTVIGCLLIGLFTLLAYQTSITLLECSPCAVTGHLFVCVTVHSGSSKLITSRSPHSSIFSAGSTADLYSAFMANNRGLISPSQTISNDSGRSNKAISFTYVLTHFPRPL